MALLGDIKSSLIQDDHRLWFLANGKEINEENIPNEEQCLNAIL